MAHGGYLQACSASCVTFCSSSSDCLLEHTSLALCINELITLYLFDMEWYIISSDISISNKYSVISSLMHRAKDVCSSKQSLEEEQKMIQEALQACKYPPWAINRMKTKINSTNNRKSNSNTNKPDNRPMHRNSVTVPYNEGLSETFKNICKRYGIQVHFKSGKTIKEELVALKDQDHITKKSGIIYRYQCDRLECDHEYIGETARTFGERFKEHLKAPLPYI